MTLLSILYYRFYQPNDVLYVMQLKTLSILYYRFGRLYAPSIHPCIPIWLSILYYRFCITPWCSLLLASLPFNSILQIRRVPWEDGCHTLHPKRFQFYIIDSLACGVLCFGQQLFDPFNSILQIHIYRAIRFVKRYINLSILYYRFRRGPLGVDGSGLAWLSILYYRFHA